MRFKANANGEMTLIQRHIFTEETSYLTETATIIDVPKIKKNILHMKFLEGKVLSVTPLLILGTITVSGGHAGVFWETFMKYIFPWFLDVAKVFCAIKIAQEFYNEKRGGSDQGTGFSGLVTYGKWLLLFHLIPWGVTLIDQIGATMLSDLNK